MKTFIPGDHVVVKPDPMAIDYKFADWIGTFRQYGKHGYALVRFTNGSVVWIHPKSLMPSAED